MVFFSSSLYIQREIREIALVFFSLQKSGIISPIQRQRHRRIVLPLITFLKICLNFTESKRQLGERTKKFLCEEHSRGGYTNTTKFSNFVTFFRKGHIEYKNSPHLG